MTRDDARYCLTRGGRQTSEAEIDRFMKELEEGTPVMPVTFICDALGEWAKLYREPVADPRDGENERRLKVGESAQFVFLQIIKSNLLARVLYGGQEVRTVPCPVHKGRWSGCAIASETECKGACMDGSNVTGWLPEKKG